MQPMRLRVLGAFAVAALGFEVAPALAGDNSLWTHYEKTFKSAKYIDLTRAFEPISTATSHMGDLTISIPDRACTT